MSENISEKLDLVLTALENGTELTIIEPFSSGLAATIGTAFITISISYLAYLWQRNISSWQIKKRVCNEIYEIIRHFSTNREFLKEIKENNPNEVLAYFHFEKMKISNKSLFFDDEVIKHYPLKWDADFRQIALFLRNNDIELDYIIDYLKKGDVDVDRYNLLIDYYLNKLDMVILNLHGKICEILGGNCKKCVVLRKYNERKESGEDGQKIVTKLSLIFDKDGKCVRKNNNNKYVMKDGTFKYITNEK